MRYEGSDFLPTNKIFGIYTVHRNNDERYSGPVTDVCSTKAIAEKIAYGSGWYGGNAPIVAGWAVEVEGKVYLLASNSPVDLDGKIAKNKEQIKKEALQKLTEDEIEALGIDLNAI